ncbi:MAG: HNH endonuclease family protein [Candidatus Pelagibacterales bacterium]
MKIELNEISIRDLYESYSEDVVDGVYGFGGKLDIRPPFQREFVYDPPEQKAVINTVKNNFPLNVLYWSVQGKNKYEVIDGQQRIISICRYVNGDFSHDDLYFDNLTDDKKDDILNYNLTVYFCSGTDSEKLDWFRTINIAGKVLTDQELRNAVYSGPWVTDAKRYFSKVPGPASSIAGDYLNGSVKRQDFLETAIRWISNEKISDYMGKNQNNKNAKKLWTYFSNVIKWVEKNFKEKSIVKGVQWGDLYNNYKGKKFNLVNVNKQVTKLILDDDVTKNSGIYPYIITGNKKFLNLRAFTNSQKIKVHKIQKGKCKNCVKAFEISEMEADHIVQWEKGGTTTIENCQMLCVKCHKKLKNK